MILLLLGCLFVCVWFCFETESLETHDGLQLFIGESPQSSEPASTSQMLGLQGCATNLFLCGIGDECTVLCMLSKHFQCLGEYSVWLFH